MEWKKINMLEIEAGIELLLYNEKWINEDYNPKGIRIGFYDDLDGWVSAYWCNYHDCYHTRVSSEDNDQFELSRAEDQVPTHYAEIEFDIKYNY